MARVLTILLLTVFIGSSPANASTSHSCRHRRVGGVLVFRISTSATCQTAVDLAHDFFEVIDACSRGCYLAPDRARWACVGRYAGRGPAGSERLDVLCLTSPKHTRRARFSFYSGGGD